MNLICKVPQEQVLPYSFLLCSLPYLSSVCLINPPMNLSSNFSVSKANVFIEPQQSAIPTIFIFYLVVKRLMIKNSVVKIQTLVVNDKLRPIKSNHVNIFFVFFLVCLSLPNLQYIFIPLDS